MIKKYFFSKRKVKKYYSKRYNMMPMPLFEYNNHFCSHSAWFCAHSPIIRIRIMFLKNRHRNRRTLVSKLRKKTRNSRVTIHGTHNTNRCEKRDARMRAEVTVNKGWRAGEIRNRYWNWTCWLSKYLRRGKLRKLILLVSSA